jgi:hypothetical protein
MLAEHNNVQLLWVLGHKRTDGNESADHLARRCSLHPLIAPEPTCIYRKVAKWGIWGLDMQTAPVVLAVHLTTKTCKELHL